ncbi:integrase family protein [Ferrimonas balearica DSM 9799]|uniref:Integrase family protein n=1 Tax=Ferrimonas balearica (strain DSM 9799 / CCM 4581 / KCTC 23876 / PAT) TaxID=550540 RepID=E1SQC8_FERBD|nr:tyrosine-type recombinase/integrase [Ferrimonas balearica]ADN77899.1 integrase family protein [Ferrimonas balearica DSM 9799]
MIQTEQGCVVETSVITNCRYKKPIATINEDGEVVIVYSPHDQKTGGTLIKKVTLLNMVAYNDKGEVLSFKPIDVANNFILSKHLNDGVQKSDRYSQGLAMYFQFVLDSQAEWDAAFERGDVDPEWGDVRPDWNHFPRAKSERLTYQFRDKLKELATASDGAMAKSVAKSYLSAVVSFYKYWLHRSPHLISGEPFEFENISLLLDAGATSMKRHYAKQIQTTDLRLKFAKPSLSGGTSLDHLRRDLKPFTNEEWRVLHNVIEKSRRVIRKGKSGRLESLPIEYSLHFMTCRFTGLRSEEAASLHLGQIVRPATKIEEGREVFTRGILSLGVGDQYGSWTKTPEAGNKSRTTIIPAKLMQSLYEYTQSERYKKRLAKFKLWCEQQHESGNTALFEGHDGVNRDRHYLFISQTGKPMMLSVNEFSNRWTEVRDTANRTEGVQRPIVGSLHNLRATFAVNVFRHLLKTITPDDALARVSSLLGHENYDTTLMYLKIAQDHPSADEIYEDILNYTGVFDDWEGAQ